jgi:MoaA/NifB/PqqE/SkfB family radical SAM enzyme
MIQGLLPDRTPQADRMLEQEDWRVEGANEILFAFDQTCNLSCPSCRRDRIVERVSDSDAKAQAVEQKLLPLLPTLKVLNLNPAGELFSSKPSRKLLELIDDERCPDLVIDIISNGTLFSEEEWNKFPGIHNKVRSIRISVDAARKETFEKLRRLGRHESFLENMRFLSRLRAAKIVPQLKFSFTYQLDNFREMKEFVAFSLSMNCDLAIFERLQNLGAFSDEEYRHKAVHHATHPCYGEFIEVISDPVFRSNAAWHDFDYPGVVNKSRDEMWDHQHELNGMLAKPKD